MEVMNNPVMDFINGIQSYLRSIRYDEYFVLIPMLMLGLCCIARLVCTGMTVLSPAKFSGEHRKTMYATARICYWTSILMQMLLWVFGAENQLEVLAHADYFAACLLAATALLSFLAAIFSMIFTRRGKRVFIAKSLNFSALMMVLMAFFLVAFGWVFMK